MTNPLSIGDVKAPSRLFTKPSGEEVTVHALPVLAPSPFTPYRPGSKLPSITYVWDADTVIRNFTEPFPLEVEHATLTPGSDTRARGWCLGLFKAESEPTLGLHAGVLYGWFELNQLGIEALANKHYRYTSAETNHTDGVISSVYAHTLTARPSTKTGAIAALSQTADSPEERVAYTKHLQLSDEKLMLEKLIKALGLADGATEDEALAAVATMVASIAEAKAAADEAAKAAPAAGSETAPAASADSTAAFSQFSADIASLRETQASDVASLREALARNTAALSAFIGQRVTQPASTAVFSQFAGGGSAADADADARARGVPESRIALNKKTLAANGYL